MRRVPCIRRLDVVVADVALLLEQAGDLLLHARVRHLGSVVQRAICVADPAEHVCNWIGEHANLLPAAFGHARDRAVVRELAQADPAKAELAVHGARAAAAAAPGVVAHLELLRALRFDDQGFLGHYWSSPSACVTAGNGIPRARRSASAPASSFAVVVIETSRPRIASMES